MKAASSHSPLFSSRRSVLLAAGVIVLAALAAYQNSFSGPLVFDDIPSITENSTIRQLWPMGRVLTPPEAVGVGGRPFLNLTFAVNYALGGTSVSGYHFVNLLIHVLAGLTLFGLVRRTLARIPAKSPTFLAGAVALLWTLHPLQTASVTYLSQRAESLMGLFYLLTLYCFVRGVERVVPNALGDIAGQKSALGTTPSTPVGGDPLWFSLSFLACFFGMATKEVMVTAPVMVLLYDRTFVAGTFRAAWARRGRLYGALAGTWLLLAYLLLTSHPGERGVGYIQGVTAGSYALTECETLVRYLGLAVWPHPLVLDYDAPIVTRVTEALPWFGVLLLLLTVSLVLLFGRWGPGPNGARLRAGGFIGGWFFLILAPTSSVVPVAAQAMAENRMYLPLAAVIVLAALGIEALAGRRSGIAFLTLALVCGWLTHRRNEDYRSAVAIWTATLTQRPDNPRAHYLLANLLLRDGRAPEALAHFEEAVRLQAEFPEAWNAWGFALAGAGRLPEAIDRYETALRLKPSFSDAAYNLANALAQAGRMPEAIAAYETALRLRPGFWQAEENLGSVMLNTGRAAEAGVHYAAALRIKPDEADLHYDLALALRALGRGDDSRAQFEAAERLGARH